MLKEYVQNYYSFQKTRQVFFQQDENNEGKE